MIKIDINEYICLGLLLLPHEIFRLILMHFFVLIIHESVFYEYFVCYQYELCSFVILIQILNLCFNQHRCFIRP